MAGRLAPLRWTKPATLTVWKGKSDKSFTPVGLPSLTLAHLSTSHTAGTADKAAGEPDYASCKRRVSGKTHFFSCPFPPRIPSFLNAIRPQAWKIWCHVGLNWGIVVKSLFYFGHRLYGYTRCYRLKRAREGWRDGCVCQHLLWKQEERESPAPRSKSIMPQTSVCAVQGSRDWQILEACLSVS